MKSQNNARKFCAIIMLVSPLLFDASLWPQDAKADSVTPRHAYEFVDSTGISTHFAYGTSKYRTQYPTVKSFLEDLGIGHIRDWIGNDGALATLKNLNQTLGVKLTGNLDQRTGKGSSARLAPDQIAGKLRDLKTKVGANAVQAIEGPNEYNVMDRDYGYRNWPPELQAYQTKLYQLVDADPDLHNKTVIAPSIGGPMVWLYYNRLVGTFAADRANAHIYPNRFPFAEKIAEIFPYVKSAAPGRKIVVTETGYHSAVNSDDSTSPKRCALSIWHVRWCL